MSIVVNSNQINNISGKNESRNQKNTSTNYKVGDLVQGAVTKVSDQISIQFSERTAVMSKEYLPTAKEGDLLNFRILDISSDGNMSLQYVPEKEEVHGGKMASCTIIANQLGSQQMQELGLGQKEESSEKESLDDIGERMTKEDYEDLSKEGFSLERYELERFERALERIKMQRENKEQTFDSMKESIKDMKEELKSMALSKIDDPALEAVIVSMMESMNLPTTTQNIIAVQNAAKMAKEAVNLTDDSMSYLLKNEMELTPVNIYMANHNAKSSLNSDVVVDHDVWAKLDHQVTDMLSQFELEGVYATKDEAKWLFSHDLDINKDNLIGYQQLELLKNEMSTGSIVTSIIKGVAEGKQAIHVPIVNQNEVVVQSAIEQFSNISDEAVKYAIAHNSKVNLVNLNAAQNGLNQETTNASEISDIHLITARRQLEEIRLKLTYESGLKLLGKGIQIHTEGLEELVTELRNLESDYYRNLLSEAKVPVSNEAIKLLEATLTAREQLSQSPSYVLGIRFAERNQETLLSLSETGSQLGGQLKHAMEAYEPLMTAPRRDMGDSWNKAFKNMDGLLSELGIETTLENQRAVRILAYNQMDINEVSIEQMKEYDYSVKSFIDALKPAATVELIKEGVNPLNTPIDEVREHLKEIASANGATEEERYSNYLAKLQKTDALTSEQRDTYIGVYRLLNNIEKTDGMAIGYLVKSGRELTMNNLLSAIQSIKATGMDTTIDDSFGLLQDLKYETKSISQQLNASFVNLNEFERAKLSYNEQISTKLYNQISPDFLEYANSKGQLMNQSLEQLEQLYQEYDSIYPQGDLASYEEVLTKVQQAMQMTGEIKFLKEHNIKVTLQNILSANHILSPSNQVRSDVSELMGEQEEAILEENLDIEKATSFLEFQMNYEKVMNSTEKYLRESFEHPTLTVESMLAINGYLNDTSLLKDLSHKQFYQVPMNVNGETVQIGLSILSGKNEKGKVSIHLESQTYGTINAQLQLNGKELKGLVVCNHRSMASVLDRKVKEMKDLLPEEIQEMQVHVCAESNVAGSLSFGQVQQEENAQQTQVLFQIAKAFISKVKEYDL